MVRVSFVAKCLATICISTFCLATVACNKSADAVASDMATPDGSRGAQQQALRQIERIQYNDTNDVYRIFVVGRAQPDVPERHTKVRLALIPDEQKGTSPYVVDDGQGLVAWLGPTFRIGLIHGFIEKHVDPETKETKNVLTHTEKRWWAPFAARKPGDTSYETPAYYYPPPYKEEGPLVGVGGSGATPAAAVESYRAAHGSVPQASKLAAEGFTASTVSRTLAGAPPLVAPSAPPSAAAPVVAGKNPALKREGEKIKQKPPLKKKPKKKGANR